MMDEKDRFASELLSEVKAQSRRYFIALILMIVVEMLTVAWFTFPTEESLEETTQSVDMDGGSNVYKGNQVIGDLSYGENDGNDHHEESDHEASDVSAQKEDNQD